MPKSEPLRRPVFDPANPPPDFPDQPTKGLTPDEFASKYFDMLMKLSLGQHGGFKHALRILVADQVGLEETARVLHMDKSKVLHILDQGALTTLYLTRILRLLCTRLPEASQITAKVSAND